MGHDLCRNVKLHKIFSSGFVIEFPAVLVFIIHIRTSDHIISLGNRTAKIMVFYNIFACFLSYILQRCGVLDI